MLRLLRTWLAAKAIRRAHNMGFIKDETINVGGYKYPLADFLGYSDEKVKSILTSVGATEDEINETFLFLETLKKPKT